MRSIIESMDLGGLRATVALRERAIAQAGRELGIKVETLSPEDLATFSEPELDSYFQDSPALSYPWMGVKSAADRVSVVSCDRRRQKVEGALGAGLLTAGLMISGVTGIVLGALGGLCGFAGAVGFLGSVADGELTRFGRPRARLARAEQFLRDQVGSGWYGGEPKAAELRKSDALQRQKLMEKGRRTDEDFGVKDLYREENRWILSPS